MGAGLGVVACLRSTDEISGASDQQIQAVEKQRATFESMASTVDYVA